MGARVMSIEGSQVKLEVTVDLSRRCGAVPQRFSSVETVAHSKLSSTET
jgi:hypothetical protein